MKPIANRLSKFTLLVLVIALFLAMNVFASDQFVFELTSSGLSPYDFGLPRAKTDTTPADVFPNWCSGFNSGDYAVFKLFDDSGNATSAITKVNSLSHFTIEYYPAYQKAGTRVMRMNSLYGLYLSMSGVWYP